ncbi:YcxB family protein [Sporolactobacillus laevolacticus]|uniref:YcxB family protein n=1 Tax=Sporolactobacillus laevolacticus TaxID=33018 RepID=UPI0025B3A4C1|nr:YcxB family protein [Sporolactobacillus laevolacticus]MDN3956281.1 YcxB family protein [Sporolactobacillus laevolacticus]
MELHYQVTKEDYIAFNLHAYQNSQTVRRSILIQRFMALIFLFVPLAISLITGEFLLDMIIIFCILGVLWFLFAHKFFYRSVRRNLSKMIDERMGKKLPIDETLILTQEGIIERMGPEEEYKTTWNGIEKIAETETHLFLYVKAMAAIIVPKSAIGSQEATIKLKQIIPEFVPRE